ncbi:hypothetical protein FDJ19_gp114 [Vibrio phage Ceto]|uniref:Uncharacterized protein n=1 Tax=Vibrio phage Ceto TaxID=2570300 RepID=A0A2H5BGS9_9CAUD|nr:hypothetical protein FDJ19_gp114 [Vibrio phage Ceto]AUG85184.1 hypothetical protein CETO_202 [Vibrio phage Ceto]
MTKLLTKVQKERLHWLYNLAETYDVNDKHIPIPDLSEESHKLLAATVLAPSKNAPTRWSIDWAQLGLSGADTKGIWIYLQKEIDNIHTTTKLHRKRSFKPFPHMFDPLEPEMLEYINKEETDAQNVYNIFLATQKIVHRTAIRQQDDAERNSAAVTQIKKLITKLNPDVSECGALIEHLTQSIKNKTKRYSMLVPAPDYIVSAATALYNKYHKAMPVPRVSVKENIHILAELATLGYLVGPVYKHFISDDAYEFRFEHVGNAAFWRDEIQNDKTLLSSVVGMRLMPFAFEANRCMNNKGCTPSLEYSKEAKIQAFDSPTGQSKYGITLEEYMDYCMSTWSEHKDIIVPMIQRPKPWYISQRAPRTKHEWNYSAIALDIKHETGTLINPDTLRLLRNHMFEKTPQEWLSEI